MVTHPTPPVQAALSRATPCYALLRQAAAACWGSRWRSARVAERTRRKWLHKGVSATPMCRESGMRLLRRLEKNHDGIRSATTRQHYIQIYQAIKYLSLDIAEFIEKGPQLTGPPRV